MRILQKSKTLYKYTHFIATKADINTTAAGKIFLIQLVILISSITSLFKQTLLRVSIKIKRLLENSNNIKRIDPGVWFNSNVLLLTN